MVLLASVLFFVLGVQGQGLGSARPRLSPATFSACAIPSKGLSSPNSLESRFLMKATVAIYFLTVSILSASTTSDMRSVDTWSQRSTWDMFWPLADIKRV